MPFAYLRQQREREGEQRSGLSARKMVVTVMVAVLFAPIARNATWVYLTLGPGSALPELWVRPPTSPSNGLGGLQCFTVGTEREEAWKRFKFCEDLHRIEGMDAVLVSCDANRGNWNTVMGPLRDPKPKGTLWVYEYATSPNESTQRRVAKEVSIVGFPEDSTFHPLGLSTLEPTSEHGSGARKLFVVNHRETRSSIEVFDLAQHGGRWQATWVRSVVHPLATHTPNSIHPLTETSFVVTNDHFFARRPDPRLSHTLAVLHELYHPDPSRAWQTWLLETASKLLTNRKVAGALAMSETLLGLPLGWVTLVEFDPTIDTGSDETQGVRAKVIAKGIPFANGLAITPNGRTMAVASTTFPGVYIYDVLPSPISSGFGWNSDFKLRTKLHLPMWADNLSLSPRSPASSSSSGLFDGHTLVATGHPAPLKLIAMAKAPHTKTAPSWSVAITPFTPNASASTDGEKWEDRDAPLPAHHFVLSHNGEFSIKTLLQSQGAPAKLQADGREVRIASSAATVYAPYHDTADAGTLIVSGLYGEVTTCTNVGT